MKTLTYIHVSDLDSIPPWFDKYFRAHLKIHRRTWRIKSGRRKTFGVSVEFSFGESAWTKEIEAYVYAWYWWARRNANNRVETPPKIGIPPEHPPS